MPEYDQLALFPGSDHQEDLALTLDADSVLEDGIELFLRHIEQEGMSFHTVKAFRSDLNLLLEWTGPDHPIGRFSTENLNRFLVWMEMERGVSCSPKTYARRVTTLKSFFSFLHARGTIPSDPAAPVIQLSVRTPVPVILDDDEILSVIRAARAVRYDPEKPDARPYLLLTLLLETGMKKAEVMALTLDDIIRDNPSGPHIWVRVAGPKGVFKERKISITQELVETIDEYVRQRQVSGLLFNCTPRNLEYVLRDLAKAAGIVPYRKLSFEALRWNAAFTDYRAGMEDDHIREKLGVSRITWRETHYKLIRLAELMGDRHI